MALSNETKARIGDRMMRAKNDTDNEWAQVYWYDVGTLLGEPPDTAGDDTRYHGYRLADLERAYLEADRNYYRTLARENELVCAIREAIEQAETEGFYHYRGTSEPTEFIQILQKALDREQAAWAAPSPASEQKHAP